MFDLNEAINHWRAALGHQPNFRSSDLDELEDHLREEITALEAGGLTPEEAFLIASRRLGKPEDLDGEFAIADPERRRSFRLSWMITGALGLVFLWLAAEIITNFGTGLLSRFPGEGIFTHGRMSLVWLAGTIRLMALALGGLLIWRLLATDRTSRRLAKMKGVTVIALAFLLAFLALAAGLGSAMFISQGITPVGLMQFSIGSAYINLIVLLVLPVMLLVGLWRLVKR